MPCGSDLRSRRCTPLELRAGTNCAQLLKMVSGTIWVFYCDGSRPRRSSRLELGGRQIQPPGAQGHATSSGAAGSGRCGALLDGGCSPPIPWCGGGSFPLPWRRRLMQLIQGI
ncbi:hypothetical protein E2562_021750 [Oryza meyeriana var. granulata]|uniref:Uncharacterized protein n=1 Tax=Oryza meyeriana var. granulata TaxID=110450 RepID=A0A6G1EY41_9ORYZ|nr:hypothetical protein E2562_021750 [Oryza meyeriana var. granulata]